VRFQIPRNVGLAALFAVLGVRADAQTRSDEFVDSVVASATRAIDQRRPWQATRLLANLTRDPTTRPPSVLLAAARAAAQWEGWESLIQLLYRETWLDGPGSGLGHTLVGRALVERSQPEAAVPHTRSGVALASDADRGERLVIHARALDRADQLDSAATTYAAAAELLPSIRDWLMLRAAGVTVDSTARRALLGRVTEPVAAARIPWTEALARDRAGDWRGAAREYARIGGGAALAAIRLRFKGDSADRAAARAELVAFLTPDHSAEDLEDAIALLDREVPSLTAAEELRVARRAAALNRPERAARGFAAGTARLADRDRFTYATVLTRLGRAAEAIPLFDQVRTPDLKGAAAYQRARLLLRTGQLARAVPALLAIPEAFPADTVPAGSALFLRGDVFADRRQDDSARAFFLASGTRYPTSPFGQRGDFQAALIAYLDRDLEQAQTEFDRIAADSRHAEAVAALYWSGRAREARGDTAEARRRYQAVMGRAPDGYYAARASSRLGVPFWSFGTPVPNEDSLPAGLGRARLLLSLGMKVEARFELEAEADVAGLPADQIVARAVGLARGQWPGRALRVAQRAQSKGAPFDRTLAELLFPVPFREVMIAETRTSGVSWSAVAGLIRQESAFDAEARSTADARGLMQVLPSVGAALMRRLGGDWDPVLLYQPDLNLDFGITHFNEALGKVGWLERALAAYNAGLDRVARWRATIRGMDDDPEIFVERIPFVETRDYVRRVMANQAMYAALYPDLIQ
jgi:soluble lytic murein transglycosylase